MDAADVKQMRQPYIQKVAYSFIPINRIEMIYPTLAVVAQKGYCILYERLADLTG
jgi:hypothetical protein